MTETLPRIVPMMPMRSLPHPTLRATAAPPSLRSPPRERENSAACGRMFNYREIKS